MRSDTSAEAEFLEPHVRGARAAHALRFELGLDIAPLADLWDVVAQRGVDLAFNNFGKDGGDGVYLWNGRRGLIVVNNAKAKNPLRQRFTAAHELGHHELHRRPGEQLVVADRNVDEEDTDLEREANAFAANLLAPDRALRKDMNGRESEAVQIRDVVRLMRRYGLSYAALLNRMVHAGCLRARDRERLQQTASSGVVPAVAHTMGIEFESAFPAGASLPEGYVLAVVDLHRAGVIDDQRLAELLRMPAARALAVAAESADTSGAEIDTEIDALLGLD